ncbi:hypothetical protein ACGFXC_33695 [Streptomyces sp. NPDC048507]|uniref:hypothetical protein n=1 Tax=Streptomyces sp. NPDC048507 TaxID=3365560 RepID=UPI0037203E2A
MSDDPTEAPAPGTRPGPRARIAILVTAVLLLMGGATGYVLHTGQRPAARGADASFVLEGPALYFRDPATGRIAHRPLPGDADTGATGSPAVSSAAARAPGRPGPPDARVPEGPSCDRFYAAGNTALCLRAEPGVLPKTHAIVLDRQLREVRRVTVPGIPNRARVSASGRMLSWTVFASGDSYATSAFSTRTAILDLRTGYLVTSMEQIPLTIDGARYFAPDVNFWGVTFARDDNRFYATVSSKGRTYLVEGNTEEWSARALRENAECPSLSPDNTRIAFKKKVSEDPAAPWRPYVLDLGTMRETPLAETRSVDDQAAWLDDATLAYALPGADGRASDIWTVPADGGGSPRLSVPGGSSPTALH